MMKIFFKLSFLLIIINCQLSVVNCFGQSAVVQSAANAYKDRKYAQAKEFIDQAAAHASTANDPKMWYYRGQIYLSIANNAELKDANPDAAEIAATSYINFFNNGGKKYDYYDEAMENVWRAGIALYNRAAAAFHAGDISSAIRYYNKLSDIFPFDKNENLKRSNITQEAINKNLYFSYYKSGDKAKAKEKLESLIAAKYNDPMIYQNMAKLSLEEKDTATALTYIDKGRKLFPDNGALINEEIRVYALQGRTDDLIGKLSETLSNDSENERLYYTRGLLYEQKKNYDKAIADYKKAVELKSDYLDANYSLGSVYVNQAAEMVNQINQLKPNETAKYDKMKADLDNKLKEAQPYLEQAKEINANKTDAEKEMYTNTLSSLKQIYARTNQTDKYNELKKELE